jgi:ubiquinone/menaquinone biosynthesis C-methylase UbiE
MRRHTSIAKQSACPSGLFGQFIARVMSVETARDNEITLDLLELTPTDSVLEVGFGHGRTLARVAERVSEGFVAGVDISHSMVRMAARHNRRLLRAGKMELAQTDASQVPFSDGRFDKVYSVHTLYFWSNPEVQFREIWRVLKGGGRFVLCFRYDEEATKQFPAPVYTFYDVQSVLKLLAEAGFDHLQTERQQLGSRTLYWVSAQRPQE